MSEQRGAEIFQFPARGPTARPASPQVSERLAVALAALDAALAEQRRATEKWRGALADLREATRGLGESVRAYHGDLDALGGRVAILRSQADGLARRVDEAG